MPELTRDTHPGRDSLARPLRPGRYCLQNAGDAAMVVISEDTDTAELLVWINGHGHRIDEMEPTCVFTRMDRLTDAPTLGDRVFIEKVLAGAARYRDGLRTAEAVLAEHLGCSCGDGSPVWDGISAAVRDGLGTAVDLLDLVGE